MKERDREREAHTHRQRAIGREVGFNQIKKMSRKNTRMEEKALSGNAGPTALYS